MPDEENNNRTNKGDWFTTRGVINENNITINYDMVYNFCNNQN